MSNCETCEERGRIRDAERDVNGTPMCESCFSGKPVHRRELLLDYEDNRVRHERFFGESPIELRKQEDDEDRITLPSQEGLSEREKVLWAVRNGCQDSCEISAYIGRPLKHVSAWLSVLAAKNEIEKIAEVRLDKIGRETFIYRAVV